MMWLQIGTDIICMIFPHVIFIEKWCHLSDIYVSQNLSARSSENHLAIAEMSHMYRIQGNICTINYYLKETYQPIQ